jgi:ribosomal protein L12E/L44/L45/RPP1/RPP2
MTYAKPMFIILATFAIALGIQQVSFAMHDSTLGVNTWIAQDNTTQVNTINLNGPINQSTSGPVEAAPTAAEEPVPSAEEVEEEDEEGEEEPDEETDEEDQEDEEEDE